MTVREREGDRDKERERERCTTRANIFFVLRSDIFIVRVQWWVRLNDEVKKWRRCDAINTEEHNPEHTQHLLNLSYYFEVLFLFANSHPILIYLSSSLFLFSFLHPSHSHNFLFVYFFSPLHSIISLSPLTRKLHPLSPHSLTHSLRLRILDLVLPLPVRPSVHRSKRLGIQIHHFPARCVMLCNVT